MYEDLFTHYSGINAGLIRQLLYACYSLDDLICIPTGTDPEEVYKWHSQSAYTYLTSTSLTENWANGLSAHVRRLKNKSIRKVDFANRLEDMVTAVGKLQYVRIRIDEEWKGDADSRRRILGLVDGMLEAVEDTAERM